MKKRISLIMCGLLTAGALFGCGSAAQTQTTAVDDSTETSGAEAVSSTDESTEAAEAEEQASAEPTEIKIWHDADEAIMQTIADNVNEALADKQITVSFEKKTGLTDQLKLYGNDAANGPDMYFYAHDSLGTFIEMGILSPIGDMADASVMGDLLPMTVEAGIYGDEQYLMPVYFETLLFLYNKELWNGDVPSSTEDLYKYMSANTDAAAGTYAVVNQHSTAYNVAPFINAFGGYIIDKDGNPGLNVQETKDAIEYNKKFAALQADGDYNTVTTLFNEKKAAAIIGGPWLISGIKDAGIDLGIKSLSDFTLPNGKGLAPYSGVQGIGVLKHAAENKKGAVAEVLRAVAAPEVGIALANNFNCAPANVKAYEDADVASNEMIMAMKTTADTAQPMPNIPQMSVMWDPAEKLLAAVNKSGEDVNTAAEEFEKQAETAIADMQ
ncbi:arabinogalactan oligomer/maltooligosaccharide transport system substrate-binding protein [Kineothrix alysoides]|uniref:Maltodextrin-binding protein n=1 Tax=Kineothrix alysoides TaxID=1469948 RepID=A0A4R1QYQ4_9FIRM|nr:extracellular solute-binding protein [Kineothrix alysoides]TCL58093.1 arabinogalactan oligomer/maltooligosaccharide transport system substrate-binding protein [Kineothrix alysoides]